MTYARQITAQPSWHGTSYDHPTLADIHDETLRATELDQDIRTLQEMDAILLQAHAALLALPELNTSNPQAITPADMADSFKSHMLDVSGTIKLLNGRK